MLDAEELAEIRRLEASGASPPQRLVGDFVITMGPAPIVVTSCAALLAMACFRIDDLGSLWVGSRAEPIAWSAVREVTFAFRFPFAATNREKLHGTVAAMTIAEADTRHVFARGAVFACGPQRTLVLPYRLSELLRASAQQHGLRVVDVSATDWVASRS